MSCCERASCWTRKSTKARGAAGSSIFPASPHRSPASASSSGLFWKANPAADVEASATTEVDLSKIKPGESVTVVWRGKPVFIRHRTEEEIAAARRDDGAPMPDPQPDEARVERPEWLVVMGICQHLGCVPRGQRPTDSKGNYGGWFCPCHGSHFDTSGRVRSGPAPSNLSIPEYTFLDETKIRIG